MPVNINSAYKTYLEIVAAGGGLAGQPVSGVHGCQPGQHLHCPPSVWICFRSPGFYGHLSDLHHLAAGCPGVWRRPCGKSTAGWMPGPCCTWRAGRPTFRTALPRPGNPDFLNWIAARTTSKNSWIDAFFLPPPSPRFFSKKLLENQILRPSGKLRVRYERRKKFIFTRWNFAGHAGPVQANAFAGDADINLPGLSDVSFCQACLGQLMPFYSWGWLSVPLARRSDYCNTKQTRALQVHKSMGDVSATSSGKRAKTYLFQQGKFLAALWDPDRDLHDLLYFKFSTGEKLSARCW